jgi:hypothetical protein
MSEEYDFDIQSYNVWVDLVSDDGYPLTSLQLFTSPDANGNVHEMYVSFYDPNSGLPAFSGNVNGSDGSYNFFVNAALANQGIATSIIALLARPGPKTASIITESAIPASGNFYIAILDFFIGTQGVSVKLARAQLEKLPENIRKLRAQARQKRAASATP